MKTNRKLIIIFLVTFLLPQTLSNHYFAKARLINREYESKLKSSDRRKFESRSVDVVTTNGNNHVIHGNETSKEIYYFTLNSNAQNYKIVTIRNDTFNNTLMFISTDTYKQDNPEQIYFYPETFREFYNFLFTNDQELNMQADELIYNINKHSEAESFFHVTIMMKIPITSTQNDTSEYKLRGIWLSLSEYKTLLTHSSHFLADLGL